MSEWNEIIGKDKESIILGEEPETTPKPKIPTHCKDCLWIKNKECRYEGDHFDNFDVDIDEKSGLGQCHSTIQEIESVDWGKYN